MTTTTRDEAHQCPDCGSPRAVGKDIAWDAAAEVPPRAMKELQRLREIRNVADLVVTEGRSGPDDRYTYYYIRVDLLDKLSDLLGRPVE